MFDVKVGSVETGHWRGIVGQHGSSDKHVTKGIVQGSGYKKNWAKISRSRTRSWDKGGMVA